MATTVINSIGENRSEVIRLVDEAKAMLGRHGRTTPAIAVAGRLTLALVGQYNAGKSTIVNALLGEKRARTGDSPETKVAQAYSLQHFDVLDLPGREARLAEQEEARRAVERAHAVLYVVSSQTGLDYDTLWRDLAELSSGATPFLLVVNDKQPHQDEDAEAAYRTKVLAQYYAAAAARLRGEAPVPFWVHAGRAERGRTEAKPGLLSRSGIDALETQLARYLHEREPFLRDLAKLRPLADALRALQESLAAKVADAGDRSTAEVLQRVDTLREQLAARSATMAEERFSAVRDLVAGVLQRHILAGGGEKKRQAVAAEVQEVVDSALGSALEAFESSCNGEFTAIQALLDEKLPASRIPKDPAKRHSVGGVPGGDAEPIDVIAAARRVLGVAATAGVLKGAAKEGAKQVGAALARDAAAAGGKALAKAGAEQAAKTGIEQAAKAGAEGALKGGAAEAGGAAAKGGFGRVLGPAVVIAVGIWELFSAYRSAEKQDRLVGAAMRQAEGQADLVAATLKDDFKGRAHALIAAVLGPVGNTLRIRLGKNTKDRKTAEAEVVEVSELRSRLDAALEQLTASSRA